MQPSIWDQIITELRLSLATRRSELAVFAVALLMGSVFVTTRLLETPVGAPSTAAPQTPISPVSSPTPRPVTPAAFQEGFGGLELSPLPTQPLLSVTPTLTPTPTPKATPTLNPLLGEPTTTPTPTATPTPTISSTSTPTPTPRTNPWAPYIP